ncbi:MULTISPECIES: Holliday junction resolvase RecU [Coprobacillaceae]|uniref:Holliday junction resolvase RecU n=1 Tax=Coprobacillaceae TaxID=2810280 RepID=UPI000E4E90BB|nr:MULTISPECIES: Holliday junction resolvase RecU [Coprobacillaceae]RHM59760.1 Holliday junction resolvase RecU [Coprobacillus sp. AF33-1AC]RHS96078.1 Holliday junction resolvase RecU [Erysipelatoclostridium sp. AM42-17]
MVNYPNKKKGQYTTRTIEGKHDTARRGMHLEEDINLSNEYYLSHDIAVIHKKPTPIQIVKVQYPARTAAKIVEAYFKTPSTTDYNGLYKGKYIDFEAKETKTMSFPFVNISTHQINHLDAIIRHQGIAFVIIAFTRVNEVYLIDASYIIEAYRYGKRQSMKYEAIKEKGHLIKQGYLPRLDYLDIVDRIYLGGKQ